jgi:hypothetical protein
MNPIIEGRNKKDKKKFIKYTKLLDKGDLINYYFHTRYKKNSKINGLTENRIRKHHPATRAKSR